ncbi:LysR family transcriptional regulator [Gymnodinialimonas hymeniacidonis]|uniref:LysR family transcriptional regulator n=1 Tax=Gymnodinialimonas hymeniacidonis TaxID=3126508 RepID=UPI0034C5E28B
MDIALIRTFLEVTATGSFVSAADRLYVTQSAVSLRVQRLEASLGRPLFTRSKAGAELTAAGREFERYALSMLKLWEEARQQVAIPEGFTESLSIGAQYSLWPRLGFRWLDQLRVERPHLNLRAELGMPDRLTRFLVEGVIQAALTYTPQIRPGLSVEQVLDEELVLVAPWSDKRQITPDHYVFVDWGPEFVRAHAMHLPHLTNTGMTLSLGAMAVDFIQTRQLAAYLPVRAVKPLIDRGELFLIADAPIFPYPAWVVWRDDLPTNVREYASKTLENVVATAETEQSSVLDQLDKISAEEVETLGRA